MIRIISKNADDTTNDVIDWLYFYNAKWKRTTFESLLDSDWDINIDDKLTVDFDSFDISEVSSIWYRNHSTGVQRVVNNEHVDPIFKSRVETSKLII